MQGARIFFQKEVPVRSLNCEFHVSKGDNNEHSIMECSAILVCQTKGKVLLQAFSRVYFAL